MSLKQIRDFFSDTFPHSNMVIEKAGEKGAVIRQPVDNEDLRPGGTVSGPVMMTVADTALYIAILGEIGLVTLAVTTNLNINFFRRPSKDVDVIGVCKLLKVGKTLIVGEVTLYSDGEIEPIAHAVATYSIPPALDNGKPAC